MGGRTVGQSVAWDVVQTFLAAEYSQESRHLRRLPKVAKVEAEVLRYPGSLQLPMPSIEALALLHASLASPVMGLLDKAYAAVQRDAQRQAEGSCDGRASRRPRVRLGRDHCSPRRPRSRCDLAHGGSDQSSWHPQGACSFRVPNRRRSYCLARTAITNCSERSLPFVCGERSRSRGSVWPNSGAIYPETQATGEYQQDNRDLMSIDLRDTGRA